MCLQAPIGQQINVTLMDLTPVVKSSTAAAAAAAGRHGDRDAAWCPVIVQLHEHATSRGGASRDGAAMALSETVVRACDSRVRKRLIYTSRTSRVQVVMPLTAVTTRQPRLRPAQTVIGHYLLYFEGSELESPAV